ncbi:MAG: GNAT family N-acetyltransferase [Spirochaetes bacterium]|nr:MAG: GNAT family N-acetyltransferase [Spirochaetota bacterium]
MPVTVRPASPSDINDILVLLRPYAKEGLILKRTREEIAREIRTFLVAESGGAIAGTISYHNYGPRLKEIRSLAVRKELSGGGIGSSLVRHLNERLEAGGVHIKVFVLTYSPDFFRKLGFVEVPKESLPEKIWKDCDHCSHREECGETALEYHHVQEVGAQ